MDIELKLTTETVDQVGPLEPLCVQPQTSVREVLRQMKQGNFGSALVCHAGQLIGIFTERDALRIMARHGELDAPVERVMVTSPATIRPDATVASAVLKMSSGGYRRLPIVDAQGRPGGVVEVAGIVHYLVQHFPKAVYNLPPVAHPLTHDREGP
jgi:CBS domain-containing protein